MSSKAIYCSCVFCHKILSTANLSKHTNSDACIRNTNKKNCQVCNTPHSRKSNFCSQKCYGMSTFGKARGFSFKQPTKVYCSCVQCHRKIFTCNFKHHLKYCNKPKLPTDLSKVQYRTATKFKFSLNKYHDWFSESFELIKTHGWYSASNKNNNLNGCSRDHMYSVSDGYKNNIQANIISHPANCRIITHPENQRKREKSIISLSELLKRIEEFDKIYGGV